MEDQATKLILKLKNYAICLGYTNPILQSKLGCLEFDCEWTVAMTPRNSNMERIYFCSSSPIKALQKALNKTEELAANHQLDLECKLQKVKELLGTI